MVPSIGTRTPPAVSEDRVKRRDRILLMVGKLNDRDTQATAARELRDSIQSLDVDEISTLLTSLCNTPADQSYARKEAIRLLSILASPVNPSHSYVGQTSQLHKVIGFYKACLKDKEARIRDLAVEAVGLLARHLGTLNPSVVADEVALGPILKMLLELLSDQKRELQAAGCLALAQVLPAMKAISSRLAKQIVRHINAPNFLAKGTLIAAIGHRSPDNGQPAGLVAMPGQSWMGLLPDILGLPGGGSGVQSTGGVLNAMQSSDWQTRRSAVECTRALVICVGPALEGAVPAQAEGESLGVSARLEAALLKLKFDKIKAVRDSVLDTLITLSQYKAFRKSGRPAEAWASWLVSPEAFRDLCEYADPSITAGQDPAAGGMGTPLRPPAANGGLSRPGSALRALRERKRRFLAAQATAQDSTGPEVIVVERRSSKSGEIAELTDAGFGPVRSSFSFPSDLSEELTTTSATVDGQQLSAANVSAEPLDSMPASSILEHQSSGHGVRTGAGQFGRAPRRTWQLNKEASEIAPISSAALVEQADLASQVAALSQQNNYLLGLMDRLTTSVTSSLASMEHRIANLEATLSIQQATSALRGAGHPEAAETVPGMLGEVWESPMATLRDEGPSAMPEMTPFSESGRSEGQGSAKSVSLNPWITPSKPSLPQLSESATPEGDQETSDDANGDDNVDDGAHVVGNGIHNDEGEGETSQMQAAPQPQPSSGCGTDVSADDAAPDINAAYADALQDPQGDLRLLRLMQKTGAVWKSLTADVATSLLVTIQELLGKGTHLPRVMPWLWALADEESSQWLSDAKRQDVVASLAALPVTNEGRSSHNVSLLVATLKATWGIEDWMTPPSPTPMPRRQASKGVAGSPDSVGQIRGPRHSLAGLRHHLQPGAIAGFGAPTSTAGPRASLDSLADMQAELSKLEDRFSQISPVK